MFINKIKYPTLLLLQFTATFACVYVSRFRKTKSKMDTVDKCVYYTFSMILGCISSPNTVTLQINICFK